MIDPKEAAYQILERCAPLPCVSPRRLALTRMATEAGADPGRDFTYDEDRMIDGYKWKVDLYHEEKIGRGNFGDEISVFITKKSSMIPIILKRALNIFLIN